MKCELKTKLTGAELRAIGMTPDLVTKRVRLVGRGNRPQLPKDERESNSSRRQDGEASG